MTIGQQLRQARLARGLSLHQIEARTNIRVPVLEYLERDQYEQVAGGIFVRSFLATFAREVGLDPDQVVAAFIESQQPPEPPPQPEPSPIAALFAALRARLLGTFDHSPLTARHPWES